MDEYYRNKYFVTIKQLTEAHRLGSGCSKQNYAKPGLASIFNSVLLPRDEDIL